MRIRTFLLAAVLIACAVPVQTALGPGRSPAPPATAYTAATRALMELGYRILAADRDAGFIRAEKEIGCVGPWCHRYDMQDIMIVPSDSGGSLVQVTPSTEMLPADKHRRPDGVSSSANADALLILARATATAKAAP